jgi:hypothetical protein
MRRTKILLGFIKDDTNNTLTISFVVLLLLGVLFYPNGISACTPELKDYYNTGDNTWNGFYDDGGYQVGQGQTFTATDDYTATILKLKLYKVGSPTGDLTINLQSTSGGLPDSVIASGIIDVSTLTSNTNGDWYEVDLGEGAELNNETLYAITGYIPGLTYPTLYVAWRADSTHLYNEGTRLYTLNGGSSWTIEGSTDQLFEVWACIEGEELDPREQSFIYIILIGFGLLLLLETFMIFKGSATKRL